MTAISLLGINPNKAYVRTKDSYINVDGFVCESQKPETSPTMVWW